MHAVLVTKPCISMKTGKSDLLLEQFRLANLKVVKKAAIYFSEPPLNRNQESKLFIKNGLVLFHKVL